MAAPDYAAPGPETFTTTDFPNGTAGSLGGKLVVPHRAGKYPLLVNTHGFSGNAAQQIGWGEHFASYGFVAVVPSMPGGLPPDHRANGDIIVALARLFSDPMYASPAQGKVDAERIGLSGHSAGGLQTTFGAAVLKPRATVLFDPVDYQMTGRPVYATLCSPVMAIFAEPGSCNVQGEWSMFKTTSRGPLVLLDVIGSNHCDPINPAMLGCDIVCGGVSSTQNQANYSRHATAYFLALLKDDASAAATLTASVLAANAALRNTQVQDAPNCAIGPADGGLDGSSDAAPPDVMPPDGTSSSDVGAADGAPSDTSTTTDAARDNAPSRDAPVEAPADTAPPSDVASESGLDASRPPVGEPPSSDAGAPPLDSSVTPPNDGGTTPTPSAPQDSGCSCAIVAGGGHGRWASASMVLVALAALFRKSAESTQASLGLGRRRARRRGPAL